MQSHTQRADLLFMIQTSTLYYPVSYFSIQAQPQQGKIKAAKGMGHAST